MEKALDSKSLAEITVKALSEKKAERIRVLDISQISILADYLIIASGNNKNQIQALCDNVLEYLHKENCIQKSIEGYENASWILIDYNDVIINIFDKESREFYDLERLFADAAIVETEE